MQKTVPDVRIIKHPDAHQIACTVDEISGQIEIRQGKNITLLKTRPGPVKVIYRKKQA